MATHLLRRNGGRMLPLLREELEQLMDEWFERPWSTEMAAGTWCPRSDLEETDDAYVMHVELPGVEPDDIEISLEEHTLSVQGERTFYEERSEDDFTRRERSFGSFYRSVHLPSAVEADAVEATHHNGVVTITVPKSDQQRPRRVEITPS